MKSLPLTFKGLGGSIPRNVVTNHDLAKSIDTSDQWIKERTGISTRYVLEEGKSISDLATEAGRQAIAEANIPSEDIDLILVATMTPDTFMPATACRVANALGCSKAGAFDLNIACSGFIYGLLTSVSQLASLEAKNILCIGGDTVSRITNWSDRRTAVLFGDAAGAAVLSSEGNGQLLGWNFGANGAAASALCIKAGPGIPSDNIDDYKVSMDGKAVFRFASSILTTSSEQALKMAGVTLQDVDLIVPHQANRRIIEMAAKRWKIGLDRFFMNLDRYGNTSAGSIPIALLEADRAKKIKPGSLILLSGFGGGLSWASVVLRWAS